MTERDRKQSVESENAILIGVIFSSEDDKVAPLDELQGLAEAAGAHVVGRLTQRRDRPAAATYLGAGKVDELADLVDQCDANLILFDNELSPAQTRNLEIATGVKVLDRTELILDIFASHAQTYESRLAVELAQLEYSLPRLKRMWTHLSRLKMGIGMRGPGEKQLEVDRRLVEKRIADLRADIRQIERRKERQVAARSEHRTVSLVGYTNAGKSTLMNALTNANVMAVDQLFATLDTRTKRWQLPNWGPVLLSDTVGFIRHLPHKLVTSFKATLEEARQADLLIHVADASNDAVVDQIRAVVDVLTELGIDEKDTLLVLNKVDALGDLSELNRVRHRYPNALIVSARAGTGLEALAIAVSDALSHSFRNIDIETDISNGKLMAYLAAHGEVLSRRFEGDRAILHCRIAQKHLGRITDADVVLSMRDSKKAIRPVEETRPDTATPDTATVDARIPKCPPTPTTQLPSPTDTPDTNTTG